MKRLLAALIIFGLLAAVGWWYWTTTPQYAVQQAASAVNTHDVAKFHNWVNVESVSSAAIDDLLAEPGKVIGGAGIIERIIGLSMASLFKDTAVESMTKQIDRWIAHRSTRVQNSGESTAGNQSAGDNEEADQPPQPKTFLGALVDLVKPPSLKQIFKEYGLTKQNYRGLGQVSSADNLAHVNLRFFNPKLNRENEVELELTHGAGHWQISRLTNLVELLRQ